MEHLVERQLRCFFARGGPFAFDAEGGADGGEGEGLAAEGFDLLGVLALRLGGVEFGLGGGVFVFAE
jgi:hypothetical protein